jgi:hypothetical protein
MSIRQKLFLFALTGLIGMLLIGGVGFIQILSLNNALKAGVQTTSAVRYQLTRLCKNPHLRGTHQHLIRSFSA